MKQALLLISTVILSFSCLPSIKYIDPWDHISLKVNNSSNSTQLSNTEVVKQATYIQNFNKNNDMPGDNIWTYSIEDSNRKPETNSFQFPGTFVYNLNGTLNPRYLLSENILLVRSIPKKIKSGESKLNPTKLMTLDTIAYIPSSAIKTAKIEIEKAFIEKRAEDCYKIFEEMMVFTPITGAEFRKLKLTKLN